MAKSLKDIIKKIAHSKGDERWIKAHSKGATAKNDAPTSRDGQFHTDVPMFDRHIEHGYNPGEDEAKYDSYQKEVAEAHSAKSAWQASEYHYQIANNLRSVADRTEPGSIKAAARELWGGLDFDRRSGRQKTKWERYEAQKMRRQADKYERAGDVAREVMNAKGGNPHYNQKKWSTFKLDTPAPTRPDPMFESSPRERLTRIMTALNEGRIKDLDTKEKEEKRLGKKVLSDDERKKLKALKKRK